MDINKPLENLKLLEKLKLLKTKNDSHSEFEFFKELIKSNLLSPVTEDSLVGIEHGETALKEGDIVFVHLADNDGNDYIPAFSDWNELLKWNNSTNTKALVLTFDDYKTLISRENSTLKGFVLNPFGDNIIFNKNLLQEIEDCVKNISQEKTVMIGVPEKYPDEMINALVKFLPKLPAVKKVYLLLMVQGDEDKSFLLVVDTTGDHEATFKQIANIAKKNIAPDEKIDFVLAAEPFGKDVVKGHRPFYENNCTISS